jgi:beta-glucosidase
MEAIERADRIAAEEAAAEGLHWTFAPMVDIARDPRWGRMAEGSGEDPYLGSRIAEARVRGFQGNGIGELNSVMACVKHFAAYGAAQAGRDYHAVDMSDRTFREVYLPPYAAAIDAGAATVMSSFNDFDGVPATASSYLLTDILRKELKFKGFVVSDYTSVMELIPHGVAADTASAAALALNAGLDMDMQAGFYQAALPRLLEEGKVSMAQVDASVRLILRKKFELGLFEDPYRYSDTAREKKTVMKKEFLEAAREVAGKSIVLLKNESVLPLSKKVKTIAVVGPLAHARREMIGSWSAAGDWTKSVTLLEGIRAAVDPSTRVLYARGSNINDDTTAYFQEAVRVARQADVVVLAVGESAGMSGEAASRSQLDLPGVQQKLVELLSQTSKPMAVVLMSGRPLTINWMSEHVPAILSTWFLGTQAGHAIADVLFGDVNPSGKLPVTFPRSTGQIPIYYSMKNTGRPMDPNNKYTSKYLDVANSPLYPFGYGLSYTTFKYSDLRLSQKALKPSDTLTVRVSLSNVGPRAGAEVAQLYVRDLVGSVTRPVMELKGFQRVDLKPGETREVVFFLTYKDLEFCRKDGNLGIEPGKFMVLVGGNSVDVSLAEFEIPE